MGDLGDKGWTWSSLEGSIMYVTQLKQKKFSGFHLPAVTI